jgi:hypothetical protein
MTNPFELLLDIVFNATMYRSIITEIVLGDDRTNHFGKDRYRLYVYYKFKNKIDETYQRKSASGVFVGMRADEPSVIALPFTEDEELYGAFLSTSKYKDNFVSFEAEGHQFHLNDLDSLVIQFRNALVTNKNIMPVQIAIKDETKGASLILADVK